VGLWDEALRSFRHLLSTHQKYVRPHFGFSRSPHVMVCSSRELGFFPCSGFDGQLLRLVLRSASRFAPEWERGPTFPVRRLVQCDLHDSVGNKLR